MEVCALLLEQQSAALDRLYELFQKNFRQHFGLLWKYLVPERGRAATAQGEVIRIIGRIEHEMLDNGGMNWDDDFRKMLCMPPQYFRMGDPIDPKDFDYIEDSQLILPLPTDYSR